MSSFTHLFYGEHRRYFEKYFNAFFLSIKWKSLGTKTFFKISSFVFPQNKSQVWNNMRLSKWWQFSILVELEQGTEPQLLPGRHNINGCPLLRVGVHGVCVCVCSLLCVCTLDGLNAEHKFRVWVTILGRMSCHFHLQMLCSQEVSVSRQVVNAQVNVKLMDRCH